MKTTQKEHPREYTPHWDKRVSAAYLRITGATQEECGVCVGRTRDTIRAWENDDRWPYAVAEAEERWLSGLKAACRNTVLESVKTTEKKPGNSDLAFKILERTVEQLQPPKQRVDSTVDFQSGVMVVPTSVSAEEWSRVARKQQEELGAPNRIAASLNGDGEG